MKKYLIGGGLAAIALLLPEMAMASTNLKSSLSSSTSNIAPAITTISYAAYVIGAIFMVTGLLKLRAHVDNPGQTPLKDSLGRLTVGALFGVMPFAIDFMRNTLAITGGSGTYTGLVTLS